MGEILQMVMIITKVLLYFGPCPILSSSALDLAPYPVNWLAVEDPFRMSLRIRL